jgi:hypothetical protein
MRFSGMKFREIGAVMGISAQRARKLDERGRAIGI